MAVIERLAGHPRVERKVIEEFEGNGPEEFRDVEEGGVFWEKPGDFVFVKPATAAAVGGDELGGGRLFSMDVIEEAAVNELVGFDHFAGVRLGKEVLMVGGKRELVFAEAFEFAMVVVAGVGAGEGQALWRVDGQIEFGREFKVDEVSGVEITKEKIELANGGVDVALELEVFFEEQE